MDESTLVFGWLRDPIVPTHRERVVAELAARGDKVLPPLRKLLVDPNADDIRSRLSAVRVACRIDSPEARRLVRDAVKQPQSAGLSLGDDEVVRQAAIHAVSVWRDGAAGPVLVEQLKNANPHTRRVAAEALGRIGDPKAVPPILEALADAANDRALDHSLTYALIETGDREATATGLKHSSPRVRRAVLAALDAIPGGKLDPKTVVAELDAKDPALKETAWWVAGKHPEWGEHLAGVFRGQLKQADQLPAAAREELTDRLVKFTRNPAVQQAVADALGDGPKDAKAVALRVVARSGLKAMPGVWAKALVGAAPGIDDRDLLRDALAAFRAVPATAAEFDRFVEGLPRAALWPAGVVPEEFRLAALAACPPGSPLGDETARQVIARLAAGQPAATRAIAADALGRAALSPDQLKALAENLRTVGPIEAAKLIDLFGKSKDESVGLALVAALKDPAVRAVLRAEQVKPVLDKYGPAVRKEAAAVYAAFEEARKDESAKLERLLKELPTGDVRRGQLVFNGAKAQCAACHKIGYVGGLLGPDLTRIGGIRTERDLLESIVFPSASFVQSYASVRVTTADGRTLNGILKKDAPDEVVLAVAADKDERVARADVEGVSPSSLSVMPAGLDQQLTVQELADLVAFLKACK
jgi:putative heme-binding domain-containing protein